MDTMKRIEKCGHCGGYHEATCQRIKAIDYYPDGTVKRIEYKEPQQLHDPLKDWRNPVWTGCLSHKA